MKPPKNELDILTQACESLSYRASVVHQWLHPIVQSSAAAKNAYAFKTRVKSSRDIRNKVQGRRNHEDPGKRKPDYKPDDVTDACGFRIVKLFNAEVPQALNELLSLLRTELAPGQLNGRLKNGVGVREIEFHTSRRLNDPLSIYNDVVQVVDNHRFQLAATGEQKVGSSYSSVHVLVDCEIGDEGSQVTGCCEIQLRSVFEEAWGEISHRLRYNPAKVARAEDPHGPQKPVPDMEFWLHLDALKSLTDGCAQYADLINRHLQRDATTRATRLPSPLDEAERSAMLFADLNEPIPTEAKQAYEIRTRATEAEDDLQRQDGYRLAAEKFVALLQRIPDTDPRHSHLREEIAFCYMFSGNEELRARAEEIYGEILEADPNRARALLRLGQLRRDADDYAEAPSADGEGAEDRNRGNGPCRPRGASAACLGLESRSRFRDLEAHGP